MLPMSGKCRAMGLSGIASGFAICHFIIMVHLHASMHRHILLNPRHISSASTLQVRHFVSGIQAFACSRLNSSRTKGLDEPCLGSLCVQAPYFPINFDVGNTHGLRKQLVEVQCSILLQRCTLVTLKAGGDLIEVQAGFVGGSAALCTGSWWVLACIHTGEKVYTGTD